MIASVFTLNLKNVITFLFPSVIWYLVCQILSGEQLTEKSDDVMLTQSEVEKTGFLASSEHKIEKDKNHLEVKGKGVTVMKYEYDVQNLYNLPSRAFCSLWSNFP